MIAEGPVCWRSKKQTIVATSSCEAEYIASCSAAKEAVWLSRLVADLSGFDQPNPIKVFADNKCPTDSLGSSCYFITFIEDYSKWTTVYTMRNKSEA